MRHLFLIEIDCDWREERLESSLPALSEKARTRAARYLSATARRNLVVTQTCLREVLKHLKIDPANLDVCPNGRPFLKDSSLEFNLSHSESRAVLAVGRHPELERCLGVDIEWMDRPVDRMALARRFFSAKEADFVGDDSERFFRVWTRKEAVLKSNGVGLRVELDAFEVLDDAVAQEVSGRPLCLGTSLRESGYLVSWALPRGWESCRKTWVRAFDDGWLNQLRP